MTHSRLPRDRNRLDKLFGYIVEYKRKHDGNSPSLRDMSNALGGTSPSLVNSYLSKLVEIGKIRKSDMIARNIEVVGARWEYYE